jgi:hypothetical protein
MKKKLNKRLKLKLKVKCGFNYLLGLIERDLLGGLKVSLQL